MLLSGQAIQRELEVEHIVISPFDPSRIKSASYVLSLGSIFRKWHHRESPILLWSENSCNHHLGDPFEADEFTLMPGEFVLSCTNEVVGIEYDKFGLISPLSHIARFGLGITGGSDFINPGFGSKIPTQLALELYNFNSAPLTLSSGMPIAHLRIGQVVSPISPMEHIPSIYEGSCPASGPQLYEEWFNNLSKNEA